MRKNWFLLCVISLIINSCLTPFLFSFRAELEEVNRETGLNAIRFEDEKMGINFIDHIVISGNHFDLGYQIGLIAKKTVIQPKRCERNALELNKQIIEMYENLYPAYLEKLKGIAKAFDLTIKDMDLRYMERDFFVNLGWLGFGFAHKMQTRFKNLGTGCSIIAYNMDFQGKQKTIVGRNFDWDQPNGAIVRTSLKGDYKTLGSTIICPDHWIMDGINEKGLFIGGMTVESAAQNLNAGLPYPDSPAVDALHMMRIILNSCASVREAVAKTEKVRIWFAGEASHFLLADSSGAMCVFEFDGQGRLHTIYSEKRQYLLSTNFQLYDISQNQSYRCWRYELAGNELKRKKLISSTDLFEVMKKISQTRSNIYARDNVSNDFFDYLQTIWTSLYDLENLSMIIHYWLDNEESFYSYSLDQ